MSDNPKEIETNSSLSKWTRLLFALSLVLLGVTFILQGFGIVAFPVKEDEIKPVRAVGIRCDEPIWDFGAIDSVKNPRLTHEFTLVNESKETVAIQKVHSTCGCMVADSYDKELEPGKSTKLKVDVQLPPMPGTFHKSLAIQLEGQKTALLPLDVIGKTIANTSLHSIPSRIHFGIMRDGESKERTVQIFRYDLSPIRIINIDCSDDRIKVDFTPEFSSNQWKAVLHVRLDSVNFSLGKHDMFVNIKTDHPDSSDFSLAVCVFVE